jgi:hypothetical protein
MTLSPAQERALHTMLKYGDGWFTPQITRLSIDEQEDLDHKGLVETDIEFLDDERWIRFRLTPAGKAYLKEKDRG